MGEKGGFAPVAFVPANSPSFLLTRLLINPVRDQFCYQSLPQPEQAAIGKGNPTSPLVCCLLVL